MHRRNQTEGIKHRCLKAKNAEGIFGFLFVAIKLCGGQLLSDLLSAEAYGRLGQYGSRVDDRL